MGYEGGRLRPWFDATGTRETAHKMADVGGKAVKDATVARTPVDTGDLRESWKQKPVRVVSTVSGHVAYESGVETDVEYAPYVEHGTGLWGPNHAKYPIRPKTPGGVLHFFAKDGTEVFTTLVMHPGSPGRHMVALAVGEVAVLTDSLMVVDMEEWARKTEKQNHSGLP